MSKIKNNSLKRIITFIMLIVGSLVAAAALECFLIPNTILDGGITGVSIILFKLFKIPLWLLVVVLNIPFLYIGFRNMGYNFLIRALTSMLSFALFLSFFELVQPFTEEILLATIFGGALLGLGVGIVIHFGGCVDGTESVAIVISKKTSLSVGQVVLFFNLIIFAIAGFIFGFDRAMYSLLTYVITFKVIDFVSEGLEQAKAVGTYCCRNEALAGKLVAARNNEYLVTRQWLRDTAQQVGFEVLINEGINTIGDGVVLLYKH